MYVCIHVSMLLSDRVFRDHSCGRIIAYAREQHEEVPGLTRNQLGRVVMTNIRGHYHVDIIWYCILVLCLCLCYDR